MLKSSRFLLAAALAACAMASAAIAASPAAPPGQSVDRIELSKASQAVKAELPTAPAVVAATGTGAASAYDAWVKQIQAAAAPVARATSADSLGWEHRQASAEPRTFRDFQRMHPGLKPDDKLTPVQRAQLLRIVQRLRDPCLNVRGPGEGGDEPDSAVRRLIV